VQKKIVHKHLYQIFLIGILGKKIVWRKLLARIFIQIIQIGILSQNISTENPDRKYPTENPPEHSVSNEPNVTTANQLRNHGFMIPDGSVSTPCTRQRVSHVFNSV
jgi:hypothetical protein